MEVARAGPRHAAVTATGHPAEWDQKSRRQCLRLEQPLGLIPELGMCSNGMTVIMFLFTCAGYRDNYCVNVLSYIADYSSTALYSVHNANTSTRTQNAAKNVGTTGSNQLDYYVGPASKPKTINELHIK